MTDANLRDFTAAVAGGSGTSYDAARVDVDDVRMPVRVLRRPARPDAPLVVLFHGSVNRASVPVPAFEGGFLTQATRLDATVVSVADPLLDKAQDLRAAWYAGAQDQDTRGAIRKLIDTLVQALSPARLILAGGSTGGHPALVHASERPESVAVVVNPIMNIGAYHPDYVKAYRATCWPGVGDGEPLPGIVEDATALYTKPGRNTVIYLQNARDGHFWHQAVPFLAALRGMQRLQSILFLSTHFEGYPGHTFPPQEWARWITGACLAADGSPASIAAATATLQPAAMTRNDRGARSAEVPAHDLAIAQRLTAWHLDASRS